MGRTSSGPSEPDHTMTCNTCGEDFDMREKSNEIEALRAASGWMPIETAPSGKVLLYFPERQDANGRNKLSAWMKIDFATHSHRQPTHWMPLPEAPTSPLSDARPQNPASEKAPN